LRTNKTIAELPPPKATAIIACHHAGLSHEDSRESAGSRHGDAGSSTPKTQARRAGPAIVRVPRCAAKPPSVPAP
jgi:hypothetical protein